MGQRSQIYLRYNGNLIFAHYYQWNFADRMVSRARWGMEYLKEYLKDGFDFVFHTESYITKIRRVFDTNFDMHDVQLSCDIVQEREKYSPGEDFNDYVFNSQDNNDGQLFVDIIDGKIFYAFTDDAQERTIMDAESYMDWDCEDWRTNEYISNDERAVCKENIEAIRELATLMTHEQLDDFLHGDYEEKPF